MSSLVIERTNRVKFNTSCIDLHFVMPLGSRFMSTNFRRMMVRCCTRRRQKLCRCLRCCRRQPDEETPRPNSGELASLIQLFFPLWGRFERPNDAFYPPAMFEMSNGNALRRHTSAYCVSMAATEATLATGINRSSLYQDRPAPTYSTDDI